MKRSLVSLAALGLVMSARAQSAVSLFGGPEIRPPSRKPTISYREAVRNVEVAEWNAEVDRKRRARKTGRAR